MKFKKISNGIVQVSGTIIILENVTTISQDFEREETYNRRLFVNGAPVYSDDDWDDFRKVKNSLIDELEAFHRARK